MGRGQKLKRRFATGQAAARAGVHIPSERGMTMKPGRGTPPPPRGISAKEPPIHPDLCALSPPASDHPQDSGIYWKHSQHYGEGWADGAKIIGKSGNYFIVEVWGKVYRIAPCVITKR